MNDASAKVLFRLNWRPWAVVRASVPGQVSVGATYFRRAHAVEDGEIHKQPTTPTKTMRAFSS